MTIPKYPSHRRLIARRSALVVAVAGAGYVAGALFHDTASFRDGSAAFARPASAAESTLRDPLPATRAVAPAGAVDWGRSDGGRIPDPRECDVAKGITTACMFMD